MALGLIVAMSKWQKIVMRANTKELEDWCENRNKDRQPKCSHSPTSPVKSAVRSMYKREEQQLAKQRNTWPS